MSAPSSSPSASQRSRSLASGIAGLLAFGGSARGGTERQLRGQRETVAAGAWIRLQRPGKGRCAPKSGAFQAADECRRLTAEADQQQVVVLDREFFQIGAVGKATTEFIEDLDRGRAPA